MEMNLPVHGSTTLESDLRSRLEGEVRFDESTRAMYAVDASNYRQPPIGVVIPRTIEDVVTTVEIARAHGAPVLSRGGGTSLSGQCCNVAVVIDFSKYLNRILELHPEERTARVQPGLVLDHLRDRAEEEHHLVFGPDPSTHQWCTLGGMIGNNSCGVHALLSGRTSDNVEELDVLTYDGVRMRVGATTEDELESIIREGGRRGEIYAGLKAIRDRYAGEIRSRYPTNPRRVSGYNLDDLLPEKGFNVARALVGSEGTCVTVLEAKVRLVPSPPHRSLVVLGYSDVFSAADHVPQILEHGPVGLEGLDRLLVEFMEKKEMHERNLELLPEGDGYLLVELGGDSQEEADDKARRLVEALGKESSPPSTKHFDDPAEAARVWEIRESGLGATARVPGMKDTWPGWEDAAVHPEDLGDYLREFRDLLKRFGYTASLYGHFGQGCVHCRIDFDLRSHDGIQTYRRFIEEASDLVVRYRGTCSGEHGDGQAKAIFLPKTYGPELMEAFRQFKLLWDPEWKMNPGKVIEADPPEANLRLGTDYAPWTPSTHFQFPDDDGSFPRATLRCVGVGKCRRNEDAFMCPSFLVTRDERDTTRGRARALFEMLEGDVVHDGWRSEGVKEALDLCLSCKGCKKECPVSVDMATYKSEFLSHYWEGRLRPRSHYAMGYIEEWARLASLAPSVANFFSQRPPFARAARFFAGVAPKRRLPAFAAEPFSQWMRRRGSAGAGGAPIAIYPDVYNDYFYPGVLRSAVTSLEQLGYRVLMPEGRLPAIRPAIHYGMLGRAKRLLGTAIETLAPYAREGIPIVALEPSTVSVFRDELGALLPHDADGQRIRERFLLLEELLDRDGIDLPRREGTAILHGHCHQKAVLGEPATRRVLEKMGLEVEEPQIGCCGMAGSFGLESEHYDLSVAVGERNLLPAVRRADPTTLVVADGFSCRTQIEEGTGRRPLHLSEVLALALGERGSGASKPPVEDQYPELQSRTVALAAVGTALVAVTAGWLLRGGHRS